MSRFQKEELEKRKKAREEQKVIAVERANEFMAKNPTASRSRVAKYSGVSEFALNKWGVKLPKAITTKERMGKSPWRIGHMI
tara:strand:+ start:1113 stop:1358 length:246 start_codon:yes stop_codon:yes gene_type:complete